MTEHNEDDTEYDNNERYEKLEENVYVDLETDEAIFVLSDEESEAISRIIRERESGAQ